MAKPGVVWRAVDSPGGFQVDGHKANLRNNSSGFEECRQGGLDAGMMPSMKLTFEKSIAAPPEVVWPYICDPPLMNLWSTAVIRLVAPGDGDAPWAIGVVRQVRIRSLGRTTLLDEVIEAGKSNKQGFSQLHPV